MNAFTKMTDEQLANQLEVHATNSRSTPGGNSSTAMILDEACRRLRGGKAEKPEKPVDPIDKPFTEPVRPADKITSTKTLREDDSA